MDAAGAAGVDAVRDRLRAAGLRVTRPRLAVYQALAALGGHRSADDVAAAVVDAGLARMSVYNALDALVRAGLVMRPDTGRGPARYEVAEAWHHHFVCRRCGAVLDVPCVVGAAPCLEPGGIPGSVVDEAQVVFRGLCAVCADRSI